MNDIFVLSHLAVVFFIPIHKLYGENQKNVELKKAILSVSPTNAEEKILFGILLSRHPHKKWKKILVLNPTFFEISTFPLINLHLLMFAASGLQLH